MLRSLHLLVNVSELFTSDRNNNVLLQKSDSIYLFFRAEKEKSKFQQELFELMSQVESANKDRVRSHYRLTHIFEDVDQIILK